MNASEYELLQELSERLVTLAEENARLRRSVELLAHEPADVVLACQGRHGDMSRKHLMRLLPHMVPRSQYTALLARCGNPDTGDCEQTVTNPDPVLDDSDS